jgi:hypothetical protein
MKGTKEPDPLRQWVARLLIVSLTPLGAGCNTMHDSTITGHLWDDGAVNRCLPAPQPNLKLYRAAAKDDVVVMYDELREKNDSIRRRAFFLKPNVRQLEQRKKPKFINPAKVADLELIPVMAAGDTNASIGGVVFARIAHDDQEFTLVWHGAELGPYVLPVYLDSGSRVKRAVLTPVTAAGDVLVVVAVVAVVAGIVGVYWYAAGETYRDR